MRKEILSWEQLSLTEQDKLKAILESFDSNLSASKLFDQLPQETKDSIINLYYLMTSNRVAGNLWQYVKLLKWAGPNQLGVYADEIDKLYNQLIDSKNFVGDDWLTCKVKGCHWSQRQILVNQELISTHGLQIYQPKDIKQPKLLVIDIDTVVFSSWLTFPKHALDILLPNKELNDPMKVRRSLVERGIFPETMSL
ncbi:MAG: hypothetical protein JNM06_00460 [Blastocatellia bacterium]|nr:hypothetical protein [Blastocatellia bacterium]